MSTTTKTLQPTTWGILAPSGGSSTNLAASAAPAKVDAASAAAAPATNGNSSAAATAAASTPLWQAPLYASAGGTSFIPGDAVDLNEIFYGACLLYLCMPVCI